MKIRYSGRIALAVTLLLTAIALILSSILSGPEPLWPGILIFLGTAAVIDVLVNLLFLFYGWARVDESGVAYRGRYGGFGTGRFLTEGESLVISGGRVYVRRPDATLEGTGLLRWMCAGRDWRGLERALPRVEPGTATVVAAARPTAGRPPEHRGVRRAPSR
ncbi:hypothetical protein [Phytomonospora endophytica]|uniref:Uncharacterized protein n=1 Tax=Phytomonospora endophytica TaxID=714109 RepID=A0A841FG72_9ACTN|nr:hypothetical protein [Phytomonospora endophytica]MBB6034864.1 hypothetical protein [Phytomonospora endophytica]GIG70567.1 hypothetical protein Pen01_68620 [Phytomonospora endophytica]